MIQYATTLDKLYRDSVRAACLQLDKRNLLDNKHMMPWPNIFSVILDQLFIKRYAATAGIP